MARPLTPKQLHYCRCRANGMNMTESYKEAYNTKNMSSKTVNEAASRLDGHSNITARIDYLVGLKDKAVLRSAVALKQEVLQQLLEFMYSANKEDTARIRAAELLGKSIGLFKDVIEDTTKEDKSPDELMDLFNQRLAELTGESKITH